MAGRGRTGVRWGETQPATAAAASAGRTRPPHFRFRRRRAEGAGQSGPGRAWRGQRRHRPGGAAAPAAVAMRGRAGARRPGLRDCRASPGTARHPGLRHDTSPCAQVEQHRPRPPVCPRRPPAPRCHRGPRHAAAVHVPAQAAVSHRHLCAGATQVEMHRPCPGVACVCCRLCLAMTTRVAIPPVCRHHFRANATCVQTPTTSPDVPPVLCWQGTAQHRGALAKLGVLASP